MKVIINDRYLLYLHAVSKAFLTKIIPETHMSNSLMALMRKYAEAYENEDDVEGIETEGQKLAAYLNKSGVAAYKSRESVKYDDQLDYLTMVAESALIDMEILNARLRRKRSQTKSSRWIPMWRTLSMFTRDTNISWIW